jgi:mono/diheme cytochrome c family protein
VGDDVLAWDATSKEYTARLGEAAANFSFSVTNVSKSNVVINWVRPSCGCTVAKLPPTPWSLAPGEGGNIDLTVDLRGKFGTLSKYVSVDTSAGQKLLNLKITVPTGAAAAAGAPVMDARTRNMQLAMADRQAVFKGDCATCHATPTIGKTGADLFQAGCAICHEAPHRASMVPDLRALKNVTGRDYWTHWITNGKPGSLMPAFSKAQGGPLTDEQIRSLAEYLDEHFPKNIAVSAGAGSAANLPAGTAAARN